MVSNNEKWSYGLLKRKSGLKDKELGAALGWLSRENKIEFDPVSYTHLLNVENIFATTYSLTGTDANLFEVSTAGSVSLKTSGLIASCLLYTSTK